MRLKLPHLLSMYGKAAVRLIGDGAETKRLKALRVGVIPVEAKCSNKRDSAFYFDVKTL